MRSTIAVAAGLAAVASAGTTTITDTVDVTITSCEPTVTNCPYKGGSDPTWGDWSVTASTTSSVPVSAASSSWDPSGTWADWSSVSSTSSKPVSAASGTWDPTWSDWSASTTASPVSATSTAPCGSYTATTPPAWFSLLPTDQLSSIQAQWTGAPPSDWCYWTYSTGSLKTTATPVSATTVAWGSPSGTWSSVAAASTGTGSWSSPVAAASTGVWSYSGSSTPVAPAVATFTGAANANTGSFALAGLAAAAVLVMA
ncbi:uncharacterized protein PV07_02110 [Cladophialophora immunda]|uniref:Uncharacterized protein n=1 Tax=Cladophialophora immunda TaxID=569365 RepID=A0A0D2CWD6_9EURO|nr:uncharacterized protein PV07_02110 [Cladophialophora immunda]KIW35413.1 hypothetical protein PV07_02110 [Cladophialophora immunda]OQV02795.1 hypothetical protein CLAIMM_07931 [Cladophialophora immunda]